MKFEYLLNKELPPLAWLADIKNGIVALLHGENVECRNEFFVEGAWNGNFSSGDFIDSDWFCGSGGAVKENRIVFSTPSHVTSGIFVAKKAGGVILSNSLHLLCAYARYRLDSQYLNYEIDFNSIIMGIEKYRPQIRVLTQDGDLADVRVVYFSDVSVDDSGRLEIERKQKAAPFGSFADYESRLSDAVAGLAANAKDLNRKKQYGMVTTISKGYDAPCCAAIAKRHGCDTAVTFKAEGKYASDSGVEIAKILGYNKIIERDADAYFNRDDLPEAEVVASGELGGDIHFSAFDDIYTGNLVFTGDRGDSIWARENPVCNDSFEFSDIVSHIGVQERKLWLGYISVPMPLFGASSWQSIMGISQSSEMKPWSVGGTYDRPIPRRICEEAGVPREMFGIQKHGAGFLFRLDWYGRIKRRMSPTAAKSFADFVKRNKKPHGIQLIRYLWKSRKIYLLRLGMKIKNDMTPTEISQIANATAVRYLFPWAGEVIQSRYKQALRR